MSIFPSQSEIKPELHPHMQTKFVSSICAKDKAETSEIEQEELLSHNNSVLNKK